jgi:ATP-binding cassette subfamily F protein 3
LRGAAGSAIERAMLIIDDLSVRVAGRLLIENATVRIPDGSRVGFVGRNGSGKSTLFNVITHDVAAEHGGIDLPSRWRVGRLAQRHRTDRKA